MRVPDISLQLEFVEIKSFEGMEEGFPSSRIISISRASKQFRVEMKESGSKVTVELTIMEPSTIVGDVTMSEGTSTVSSLGVQMPPMHAKAGDGGGPVQFDVLGMVHTQEPG
jgi:hypothetical protein